MIGPNYQTVIFFTDGFILRKKIQGQVKLSQCERIRLATVGKKIGIKALRDVAMIVKPETILTWYRKLIGHRAGDIYR